MTQTNNSSLPGSDDSAELRTCLRDLVGLLGVPALWSSREPLATIRLLAETLAEILSLDACYVSTQFTSHEEQIALLYVNGRTVDPSEAGIWHLFTHTPADVLQQLHVTEESTPLGRMQTARFSLSYYGHAGQITVGSLRSNFPKSTELVLLRAAASLAASGLKTARLTQEREKALRAKDEFLAMLGHELRNPLAPIVAALDLMKLRPGWTPTPEHSIIERQVGHLIGLVDDLLDVTRVTSGKIELKHESLELASIVSVAVETARPLIEQRSHQLQCDVPAAGLLVRADKRRLAQSISNLLINAAKYTEPGGVIRIIASCDEGRVSLKIKDSGIGIAPDLLPRVFDLFEQGSVSMDRSRGGLGIGLAIVKTLVGMHDGTVTADSKGAGLGSTFTITLPVLLPRLEPSTENERDPDIYTGKSESILVVDDNQDAADLMGELLAALGHDVHVRYGPLQALALCEQLHPTVVILDVGLPDINGYELAGKIREKFTAAPPRIIAVTGYGQPQDHERSREAGIELHMVKPISLQRLLAHLQSEPSRPQAAQ